MQENAAEPVVLPHAIQSNLPVPSRLDTHGNIAQNWKKLETSKGFLRNCNSPQPAGKPSTDGNIFTCIGSDALEVYNTLPFESDNNKLVMISKVLELIEKHCIGQTNVIYECYCFNNKNQETGESFDEYLMALKAPAKTCNFGTLKDELIRDRIVCGICDTGTRKNSSK